MGVREARVLSAKKRLKQRTMRVYLQCFPVLRARSKPQPELCELSCTRCLVCDTYEDTSTRTRRNDGVKPKQNNGTGSGFTQLSAACTSLLLYNQPTTEDSSVAVLLFPFYPNTAVAVVDRPEGADVPNHDQSYDSSSEIHFVHGLR